MWNQRNICRKNANRRHAFDAVTHQCVCGAWQRGFKPAKEFVKPRAECQICERQQAVDANGRLGHHGYRRPGWGFITGDCFGQGHLPYPETDALEQYLIAVNNWIESSAASLEKLPTLTEMKYTYKAWRGSKRNETITVTITKGSERHYDAGSGVSFPSFESMIDQENHRLKREIANGKSEATRVANRIAKAAELVAVAAK